MRSSNTWRLVSCASLILGLAHGVAGMAQAGISDGILIGDAKSQPESLTLAPGGALFVGSASSPFVYKLAKGAATAEKFVDASGEGAGTFFFGMLADAAGKMLWTCQLTPVPDTKPTQRHTAVRGFDLATGTAKVRWDLPGITSTCNDLSVGPDKALYVTDTANGRIFRMPAGGSAATLYLEDPTLKGVDGITFMNGVMYVNNVGTSKLYLIPVEAGKPGAPVEIEMNQPVKGPDGMRAANGKLYIAENGGGKILALTVNGDKASVTVLKDGLKTPTGVEPAGDGLWITERSAGKVWWVALPK